MDIDAYQQCPCHSEKKIKFCCGKEIVTDLNQILAKNSAGQGLAALELLDRTLAKTGPRDCLLTIQTHILIAHGEIEKAKKSNELFLEKNPKHSTGLHHRALIKLAEGDVVGAVESLQDAMDAIPGNEIPMSLAQAFRVVGLGLMQEGHLVGARAHLQFAQYLKNDSDKEISQMIFETFRIPDAPLLLKQDFRLLKIVNPDADAEWVKKYANVQRAIDRGQFRKALKFLKKIDANFPVQPAVVRSIAVLNMQLGYFDEIAPAWRRYSKMEGLPELEAIESEAIAQLFQPEDESAEIEIARVTFELTDFSAALEKALSSPRLASTDEVPEDPFQEGPAPRNAFYLLDRKLVSREELNADNVSDITSELLMFGKQTDRPARLEWVAVKSESFAADQQFLQEMMSGIIAGEPKTAPIGMLSAVAEAMTWNWHLPPGVTHAQHTELVQQKYRDVLNNRWSNISFAVLDNKSPLEASKIPELIVPLQALLVTLEQTPQGQADNGAAIGELRTKLALPALPMIELSDVQGRTVSPLEQQHLRIESVTDKELLELQSESMAIGNLKVLRRVAQEILNRPEMEGPTRDMTYSLLAQLTDDEEQGLEYLAKARSEAKKLDRPIGVYLVQEFEFRIARGMTEKLPALLQTIQLHHMKDPEVEYHLSRVLERYGLLRGQQAGTRAATAEQSARMPATQSGESLWGGSDQGSTRQNVQESQESEASEASEASSSSPSKLWIPD